VDDSERSIVRTVVQDKLRPQDSERTWRVYVRSNKKQGMRETVKVVRGLRGVGQGWFTIKYQL